MIYQVLNTVDLIQISDLARPWSTVSPKQSKGATND